MKTRLLIIAIVLLVGALLVTNALWIRFVNEMVTSAYQGESKLAESMETTEDALELTLALSRRFSREEIIAASEGLECLDLQFAADGRLVRVEPDCRPFSYKKGAE